MSAPQFTLGPWSFNDDYKLAPWSFALNVMDARDQWVASTTRGWEGNGEDENSAGYANARLIAAAPDLFEWLEAALDEREQEHGSLPDGAPHWSVRARHALAKARGDA